MSVRSVKVTNVSLGVSEPDIKEFFSYSGEIEHIEMKSGDERSQIAFVTFQDHQGAETALLLSGATIVDMPVAITLADDYHPPVPASDSTMDSDPNTSSSTGSVVQKAEDVVSTMLAKGFVLGKDVLSKAKSFDERHQLTSTATAKVASLDQKIGLSEKVSMGTSAVNEKVKDLDQKLGVSDKTKSVFSAAEQTVSTAGSVVMKNRYMLTGAIWVTGAYNRVVKAAGDVGSKTKEKVAAEEEQKKGATTSTEEQQKVDATTTEEQKKGDATSTEEQKKADATSTEEQKKGAATTVDLPPSSDI